MSRAIALLAWVVLVPLIHASLTCTPKRAFFKGWFAGTVVYVALLYWIVPTFLAANQSLFLAMPSLLALAAYLGLYWGVWTWLLSRTSHVPRSPSDITRAIRLSVYAASTWVVLEWLRSWLFSGFPWAMLSDSQIHVLPLIQIASITGAYGISFLIVLGNLAIYFLWKYSDRKPLTLLALLLSATLAFGFYTLHPSPIAFHAAPIKIALLQGNVDQYKKWDDTYVSEIKATYETLTKRATEAQADLIIWPETSVPGYLLQEPALRLWLTKTIWPTKAHHIVGSPSMEGDNALNSAFSIHPTGFIQGQYDKQHLVPFGEVVPFKSFLGQWISVLNALGGFTAGTRSPVLNAAGIPVGVNICYEAIFPNLVRQSVKQGAQLLINITNDGWYMRTAAPYQHLAPNVYRAIENRRWLARANNTGVSAIIDPQGRIIAQTPIYVARVLTGTLEPRTDKTFYTRFGDVFVVFCMVLSALFIRQARKPAGPIAPTN